MNAEMIVNKMRKSIERYEEKAKELGYDVSMACSIALINKSQFEDYKKDKISVKDVDQFGVTIVSDNCKVDAHVKRIMSFVKGE